MTGSLPIKVFAIAIVIGHLGACKESSQFESERDDVEVVLSKQAGEIEFYADSTPYLKKNEDFFFKVYDETFSRVLSDLPLNGEVADNKKPYSGHWYPETRGGTNVVVSGGQTPLQKYDQAFHGGEDKSAAWERDKHTSQTSWAGHCNGFAASAQRFKEPFKNVTENGVTFTPGDIKALLAEIHMSADFEFLGGNRCELEGNAPRPQNRPDPTVMDECEDINPGTLHAALANWIGRMKHTLIMDQYTTYQVWNYPFYKYDVIDSDMNISKETAMNLITGGAGNYIFNPNAVKFARLTTRLTYANALDNEQLGQLDPATMTLSYVLEMDSDGKIIGGEWIGDSQLSHPDFLWVALPPTESNGTRFMGNPHVDPDQVIRLWALASDSDPDNPPQDIVRPVPADSWGKWPNFEVTLDGGKRGAVYAGKKTVLSVERRLDLEGNDVSLDLSLNGVDVATLEGTTWSYKFDPGVGLNRFVMRWKRAGEEVEARQIRFMVMR